MILHHVNSKFSVLLCYRLPRAPLLYFLMLIKALSNTSSSLCPLCAGRELCNGFSLAYDGAITNETCCNHYNPIIYFREIHTPMLYIFCMCSYATQNEHILLNSLIKICLYVLVVLKICSYSSQCHTSASNQCHI